MQAKERGRGDAGQGLRAADAHLGLESFWRRRVGQFEPRSGVHSYKIGKFKIPQTFRPSRQLCGVIPVMGSF